MMTGIRKHALLPALLFSEVLLLGKVSGLTKLPLMKQLTSKQMINLQEESICKENSSFLANKVIESSSNRREVISGLVSSGLLMFGSQMAVAVEEDGGEVIVAAQGQVKQLFREGQAYEFQGNMAAAQRVYTKVTKIVPKVGWHARFFSYTELLISNVLIFMYIYIFQNNIFSLYTDGVV